MTDKILTRFFKKYYTIVENRILEKVYENALVGELRRMGLKVEQQVKIAVFYEGDVVGEYFADLLVEDVVIIEIKATRNILDEHAAQLLNYLRATPYEVGLLLNFGPKA